MNFFRLFLLKLLFISDGSIGRKSYIAGRLCSSTLTGQQLKSKKL
jgi:hypothetical protein